MATPFAYQVEDAKQIATFGGRCLLANSMGLGKSLTSLLYAHNHPQLRPMVIVCPASLKWQWELECNTHFNMLAEVLEGTKPPKGKYLPNYPIVILNYDILYAWVDWLTKLKPKLLILDESHFLASRSSRRSRVTKKFAKNIPHIVALSGTPLVNRPAELWQTLHILRPDLYPTFWPFGQAHCAPHKAPWGWTFQGATRLNKLHRDLSGTLMIRRTKEEVLKDLPEKIREVVPFKLDKAAMGEYSLAERDFVGWLKEHAPGRVSRAVRAERLVQLGYLKRLAGVLKLDQVIDWVQDFLEAEDGKLVLFTVHKRVINALEERFKGVCVKVDGSVSLKDRQKAVQQFERKEKTRLFLGNMKAAGVGLNLTVASNVAFCELGWTPGGHAQAEDRCHRIGTKSTVTVSYLIAKGTIEQSLVKLLQQKQEVLSKTLDGQGRAGDLDIFDLLSAELLRERREK